MAQDVFKVKRNLSDNWFTPPQPDKGLEKSFESTYKDDATRTQGGDGKFTRMFTVESFGYKVSDAGVDETAQLLQIVVPGYFWAHYFSPYYGGWRDAQFYVGRGSLSIGTLQESKERYDSISFNIVGVKKLI